MKTSRILVVSVVPYVNGNRARRAYGIVATGDIPNTSLTAVEWCGIPLILVASVRVVGTSGVGHRVCGAKVGRYTKIGMRRSDLRRNTSPTALNSDKNRLLGYPQITQQAPKPAVRDLGPGNKRKDEILCGYQVRF
jgi:hypothetical protein